MDLVLINPRFWSQSNDGKISRMKSIYAPKAPLRARGSFIKATTGASCIDRR